MNKAETNSFRMMRLPDPRLPGPPKRWSWA